MDTNFNTAIALLRSGKTEEGLQMLETSEGSQEKKNIAKAEISYYKSELKNAMFWDEHSLAADSQWYDPLIVVQHLRAYVLAAKELECISRAKEFLDYYINEKRKEYDVVGLRPFINIYENAMLRLDGKKGTDEPLKIKIITEKFSSNSAEISIGNSSTKEKANTISHALTTMWNTVETDYVLNIYEQYADFLTLDDHHIWAARNYIKLQKNENAEKAIMRCVKIWKPTENFTVLPMKFFLFKDIAAFLTPKMKLEILSTKKNIQ